MLLVSPDFLASDFIDEEELPPLYDGADRGEVTLIPIPIKASAYKITRLKDYQWPCDPETPLDGLEEAERNRTLVKIVEKIDEAGRQSVPASTVRPSAPSGHSDVAPEFRTGWFFSYAALAMVMSILACAGVRYPTLE